MNSREEQLHGGTRKRSFCGYRVGQHEEEIPTEVEVGETRRMWQQGGIGFRHSFLGLMVAIRTGKHDLIRLSQARDAKWAGIFSHVGHMC